MKTSPSFEENIKKTLNVLKDITYRDIQIGDNVVHLSSLKSYDLDPFDFLESIEYLDINFDQQVGFCNVINPAEDDIRYFSLDHINGGLGDAFEKRDPTYLPETLVVFNKVPIKDIKKVFDERLKTARKEWGVDSNQRIRIDFVQGQAIIDMSKDTERKASFSKDQIKFIDTLMGGKRLIGTEITKLITGGARKDKTKAINLKATINKKFSTKLKLENIDLVSNEGAGYFLNNRDLLIKGSL